MSFFTLGTRDRIKKDHYLLSIDKLINWGPIRNMLVGLHTNEINPRGGPKAYDNSSMFKALLLGQWHSLSDPGLEEAFTVIYYFKCYL